MALASLFRLARAGYVMAREGVFGIIELPDLPPAQRFALRVVRLLERRAAKDKSADKRLSDALSHLGPSYVKLGQFMATRPDVVGRDMAQDLTALQDQIPPFPMEAARKVDAGAGFNPIRRYVRDEAPNESCAPSRSRHASNGLIRTPLTTVPWLLFRSIT